MQYLATRNYVQVLGSGWCGQEAAMEIDLSPCDLETIGPLSRANVARWLESRAGGFASIADFSLDVDNGYVLDWEDMENAFLFADIMFPQED